MSRPWIKVRHRGRLGNRMFQAMLALTLHKRVPAARVTGLNLPEWGIFSPPEESPVQPTLKVTGQRFNLDEIAWLLNNSAIGTVELDVWAQRLSYFDGPGSYQSLFRPRAKGRKLDDNQILINIRGEDILTGWHSKYYPLPFSFYRHVIETTGLAPVFMGQLDNNKYTSTLKARFPNASFFPTASVMEDFETLRTARHVVLSISTFAWLATWLSMRNQSVHLPVAGVFDPNISDTLLLPINDPRYQFYRVSIPAREQRQGFSLLRWVDIPQPHDRYSQKAINSLVINSVIRRR